VVLLAGIPWDGHGDDGGIEELPLLGFEALSHQEVIEAIEHPLSQPQLLESPAKAPHRGGIRNLILDPQAEKTCKRRNYSGSLAKARATCVANPVPEPHAPSRSPESPIQERERLRALVVEQAALIEQIRQSFQSLVPTFPGNPPMPRLG